MEQLLIVEDDIGLNQGLCKALKADDRQIISCHDLKAAREQLLCGSVSLVLLDINLPDGSGLELLREIKENTPGIPVILLTANDTDLDIVDGLERGADDYITKPFSLSVLRARVNTQLRKQASNHKNAPFHMDLFHFDFEAMTFYVADSKVELSKTEQKLLRLLVENRGGNVTKITEALEQHQMRLMKDSAVLDKMYEQNLAYFKELSMYILAGKKKLREVREGKLNELHQKAAASGLPEDAQAANDLESKCDRFEKKLHDLELTRTISMQTAPQIRMIQNNDTTMIEKIQTTIVNTIPLWKSQMVLALGIAHSTEAAQAQRQVTDFTNELLKKNAETLHLASVETAKESQRGIVDIETLKKTNQELIQTLDDVMKIQQEGGKTGRCPVWQ